MIPQADLDRLLQLLDADSLPSPHLKLAIADSLEERGRYMEACVLRECQMYAIRQLKCGHMHVRPIGCGFDLGQLGQCGWTMGEQAE